MVFGIAGFLLAALNSFAQSRIRQTNRLSKSKDVTILKKDTVTTFRIDTAVDITDPKFNHEKSMHDTIRK